LAVGPTTRASIGTSRQPSTRWPSSATTSSRPLARRPGGGIGRQEHLADAVAAAARHVEAQAQALGLEEAVGQLQRDASAVAGVGIGAARAAVGQPVEHPQRVLDDAQRLLTLDVGDEADATRVVLGRRIVETEPR
jgi:hypothetical protein